jgi:hypothetical protein
VKSNIFKSKKAKDYKDGQSYGSNVDLKFFCGVGFSKLMALYESMPHML